MKNFIKTFVLLFTILILGLSAHAQNNINGKVTDAGNTPLSYTNVILRQSGDSTLVKGTVSNEDGSFVLDSVANGSYILQATMVGYASTFQKLQVTNQPIAPLIINMQEETEQLDEIMIKAQKPLYEKKADRTVVNVQSRVTTASKSVLEVLAQSPGVIVNQQNNNISMFGKNGVGVMINGKLNQLPIEAVVQMLNGMNAANVEKIELITSPPAKYDAGGVGGLINIVTKQTPDLGTNGNITLTGGYNKDKILAGNFNLNHRKDKLSYFLEYSIRSDDNEQLWLESRTIFGDNFDQHISIEQDRVFNLTEQYIRAGFTYDLNTSTTVNVLVTGHKRNWYMNAFTENINKAAADSTIFTTLDFYENNIWHDWPGY